VTDLRWASHFQDAPALIEPASADLVRSLLVALSSHPRAADLTGLASTDDAFWTELGDWGSEIRPYVIADGVLQIPVKGVLLHDFPYAFFGYATGYDYIWRAFERGMEDGSVRGIALVIDSPGGMVAGCFNACDKMTALSATAGKPVRAYAAESAYSAAYAIAAVADTITVSRTGGVGSVGVVTMHVDVSGALQQQGVKVTYVHAGKHKVDGNSSEPLSATARARIQSRIDEMYGIFVDHVAGCRGMSADDVRATEALCFTASEAKSNGLADAIGALDDSLAEFAADLSNLGTGTETMPITNKALASAAAIDAAVRADRERISAIINSEEGLRQPKFAQYLATEANLSLEQALGCLEANAEDIAALNATPPNPFAQFMDRTAQPCVGAGRGLASREDDDGEEAGIATADLARRLGLKGFGSKPAS
jgi:capsid assembly protease